MCPNMTTDTGVDGIRLASSIFRLENQIKRSDLINKLDSSLFGWLCKQVRSIRQFGQLQLTQRNSKKLPEDSLELPAVRLG